MNDLKIEHININDIKPYSKNAKKHPREQIEQIKKSIQEFGNNDPIAVWNNEIVEGHGRYLALKELGATDIPIIKLDHLTDEQRKAYILVHNKLTMNSDFDTDLLFEELEDIIDIDMEDFGFEIESDFGLDKENERHRTNDTYNLEIVDIDNSTNDFWQMPIINNDNYIPSDLTGFNYAKTSKNKNTGIHFYIDDYQFERLWNNPNEYVDVLSQYDCILTPDFSLYTDMPMPMKIWNTYRSRQIGQYYQSMGIKVIPTISWCEEETFKFCFKGIPKGSIVSISTIGVKNNDTALNLWKKGMDEMIRQIEPSTILVYGGIIDYDYGNINVRYYENKVTERMKSND